MAFLIEHATVVDEDGNPVDLTPPEPAEAELTESETAEVELPATEVSVEEPES